MSNIDIEFSHRVLDPPHYGWSNPDGSVRHPSVKEVLIEILRRINVFSSIKNWVGLSTLVGNLYMSLAFFKMLMDPLDLRDFLIGLGFATFFSYWEEAFTHRFAHHSFKPRNKFSFWIINNLYIKGLPLELHMLPHMVHHLNADKAYDPYNAKSGWLVCFVSDVIHQNISKNLNEADYNLARKFMSDLGFEDLNTYQQYQRWGTLIHPLNFLLSTAINWVFWWIIIVVLFGFRVSICAFGLRWLLSVVVVRNINFIIHGFGKDNLELGREISLANSARNNPIIALISNYHNNHHAYPQYVNTGFKRGQLDIGWLIVKLTALLGISVALKEPDSKFREKIEKIGSK